MENFLIKLVSNDYDKELEYLIEDFLSKLKWNDVGDIYTCSLSGRSSTYDKNNFLIHQNCSIENEKRYNKLYQNIVNFFIRITPNTLDWYKVTFIEITKNLSIQHYNRKLESNYNALVLQDIISHYTLKKCNQFSNSYQNVS